MSNPILIAVPQHLVPAVADLIANDGRMLLTDPPVPDPDESLVNGWTEPDLRQHYIDSSEKMRAFLVFLAEHPDEEVTSEEAAAAIGYPDWNSIAGMLGAAQRRAGNHFGRSHGPWKRRWDSEGIVQLRMPTDVAAVVLDEASSQEDR
jgi:hypothetical protein